MSRKPTATSKRAQGMIKRRLKNGVIEDSDRRYLLQRLNISTEDLLLETMDVVKKLASPETSGYKVGAAALGGSGNIYAGVNVELKYSDVSQTIHAEQCAVINAFHEGESTLQMLAVSAAPCGYCRQFLYEINGKSPLQILFRGQPKTPLSHFLPSPFGPQNLGVQGGLLTPRSHGLSRPRSTGSNPMSATAVNWANKSYAPYTSAFAGVALMLTDGHVLGGTYLENAAFNPSLSPIKTALCRLLISGRSLDDVRAIYVAQAATSKINHMYAVEHIAHCLPGVVPVQFELLS